jgi:hypothetical protein
MSALQCWRWWHAQGPFGCGEMLLKRLHGLLLVVWRPPSLLTGLHDLPQPTLDILGHGFKTHGDASNLRYFPNDPIR